MKITRKKIYSAAVIAVISFCIFFTFFPKSGNINPVAKPFSAINSEKKLSFRSVKAAPAMENVYSDMATSNSKMVAASFNDSVAVNSIYAEEAIEHLEKGTKNGETKKLIKTGNVSLEVNSLSETVSSIEGWVKSFGGYISNKNEDSRSIYICAHIPSGKFDEAFNQAGSFGKLVSKNVNSRDVTEQYYDLEGRLSTQKALLEKMKDYLKNAKNMNEILQIESKISSVTGEIERMTSQMKRLSGQIEYSQIDISAYLPVNQSESGFVLPDTKSKAREFAGNVLDFFASFIFNVLYVLIFGTVLCIFVVFVYWIGFGKIGIIRKLFEKVK